MQHDLAAKVVQENVGFEFENISMIGGLDISFVPKSKTTACVALIVMEFSPQLIADQKVSEHSSLVYQTVTPLKHNAIDLNERV